ncbi:hypothetical protein ATK74_0523 [Propionicimonas paludicola]|uniref:Uncharacterized protein n=1 Tax=Propionicimonas paludicola TaxID=185243 RepID=A0A2A9CR31_9ACTN|nr:hypothetical protein [Propionicimonas paludicola]PFG15999.1 hypothetical protein ATK74_0523 [Propionicimonas paludicola]
MSILSDSTHPPLFPARRQAVYLIGRLGAALCDWAQRTAAAHEFRLTTERERAVRALELRRELAEADFQRAMVLSYLRASHLR